MTTASLRLRLLAGAAAWIGLALIAVGLLLAYLFRAHLEASAETELRATLNRLVAQIDRIEVEDLDRPLADPRYELPYGGLYWQVNEGEGQVIARSPSLFDVTLEPDPALPPSLKVLAGPAGAPVLALSQAIQFSGSTEDRLIVTVARDRQEIDLSVRTFSMQLASALVLVWGALTLAALLQVHLGLAPLATLRSGIEDIRAGRAEKLRDDYPREISPLVAQVNGLLEAQKVMLEFARARAGDLAHALRTPLAALHATQTRLRELGDDQEADALDALVQTMNERIEYQLRLTQLRLRSKSATARASLSLAIEQVVSVLKRGDRGGTVGWTIECPPGAVAQLDRHDLIELVGVLLENALRHTRDAIEITVSHDQNNLRLVVTDNGPGMSQEQMRTARERGVRHDQSDAGTGLGLSIAHDIVEINGGSVDLERAPTGGLRVTVTLPGAIDDI